MPGGGDTEQYRNGATDTTWSFNTATGEWKTLAPAPTKHTNFMVLEQPRGAWVSSIPDSPAPLLTGQNRGFERPLNYNIKTNKWTVEIRIAPRPPMHANGDPPVSITAP